MRVLILDDDERLSALLVEYLGRFGWEAAACHHPDDLEAARAALRPDVLILDLMLPGRDGFEVLRQLRASGAHLPVIMLSARGEVADRVAGLELGADDYLPKPFEPRELAARIAAIHRRETPPPAAPDSNSNEAAANILKIGDIELDLLRLAAYKAGANLDLTGAEFMALALLVRKAGQIVDRDLLRRESADDGHYNGSRATDILVSRLRQKLGDNPADPRYIRTLRGRGYIFLAPK